MKSRQIPNYIIFMLFVRVRTFLENYPSHTLESSLVHFHQTTFLKRINLITAGGRQETQFVPFMTQYTLSTFTFSLLPF